MISHKLSSAILMYPQTYSGQLKEFIRLRQLLTITDILILLSCYVLLLVHLKQVDINVQFIPRCIHKQTLCMKQLTY